ncbi:MAG: hypothetical protein M1816_005219 [Peltula sp. TS41687]|nr:MAG: hypothetical protein M1816_005219 [Peltula sp. TS41687]
MCKLIPAKYRCGHSQAQLQECRRQRKGKNWGPMRLLPGVSMSCPKLKEKTYDVGDQCHDCRVAEVDERIKLLRQMKEIAMLGEAIDQLQVKAAGLTSEKAVEEEEKGKDIAVLREDIGQLQVRLARLTSGKVEEEEEEKGGDKEIVKEGASKLPKNTNDSKREDRVDFRTSRFKECFSDGE